jgi:hypothetical protein
MRRAPADQTSRRTFGTGTCYPLVDCLVSIPRHALHGFLTPVRLLLAGGARTLSGVLSDGRHASSSSRIKPAYFIVGGVIVVAAVVLGFVFLGGGGGGLIPILGGSPKPPTPEFAFDVTKVTPVATRNEVKHAELQADAEVAADEVTVQMDALYMGAFLDPDNWLDGSYDSVWELFESGASAEAQLQIETLTAGVGAGDAFEQILPDEGTLKTKVLFDQKEQAFSVVAITRFEAVGTGKDGDDVRMTSRGQFVFQQVDGEWRVVSFKVLRDNEVEASASPSASPSGSTA